MLPLSRSNLGIAPAKVPRAAASICAVGACPRATATNSSRAGPARPSARASSSAVSLRAVRLIPRSRSLTERGLTLAASASSSCVSSALARSCRNSTAKLSPGCSATAPAPPRQPQPAGPSHHPLRCADDTAPRVRPPPPPTPSPANRSSPAEPPLSRSRRPRREQPIASAGPRRAAAAARSQPRAGRAHRRAQALNPARSRGPATRLDPLGTATQIRPLHLFPAAHAHRGKRPPQPAPGTAGALSPAACPRPAPRIRIQRAVTAGSEDWGRFLWVSCGSPAGRSAW
jgi:hypothetical protein